MEEEPVATVDQGDTASIEEGTSVDVPNSSPVKRGRGRPQGSQKLKVSVTELVSSDSNEEPSQPRRGRGRPRLSDTNGSSQTPSGRGRPKVSKNQTTNEGDSTTGQSSKKGRGRPKKSAAQDMLNGSSSTPKRGRPKGSHKRKAESLTSGEEDEGSPVTPQKRGRPRGSPSKKTRLARSSEGGARADGRNSLQRQRGRPRKSDTSNGVSKSPRRGRGRPRKSIEQKSGVADGSQLVRRGRGRPKGSSNKVRGKVGRPKKFPNLPTKGKKRGRPRQQPAKRGRPRKYPLPSPDELKKPKVWKPLGRPRKYPHVDPPEGDQPPRRSRGRPRKSDSKKGAHFRKSLLASPSTAHNVHDGHPRKRGRPSGNASSEDAPRKRGRPKGSPNKAGSKELDSSVPNHSKAEVGSPAVCMESDAEVEKEMEVKPDVESTAIKDGDPAEETFIDQDVSFDVGDQA